MNRNKMIKTLQATSESDLPWIFIPSYKRPHFSDNMSWLHALSKEALEHVFIVIREEQYDEYAKYKQNQKFQFIKIPYGTVTGVGSTRQFIMDFAIDHKLSCIMDMDHDIKYLQYLYGGKTKSGNKCSKHSLVRDWIDHPEIPQLVLQLAGKIARECFREHKDVLLGSLRKQHFSQSPEYSLIKYQINKGPTPRQTKILNMKAIYKAGIYMPKAFDLHGDDIGFAAEVLQNGYSCFNIPCLCYDYIDDQVDSVVRDPHNPEKNRWLHKLEYDGLQQMEIKHYLKESFKFPDGQYKFGDIDWMKYHKLHHSKPIVERW